MDYKTQIDKERLPRHIAIIMDGNGRWAKKQGLARMFGHKQGVETVHNITVAATALGVEYLTLYTFSTENWNRPKEEVDALMTLLVDTIVKETPTLMNNNVRLQTIGDIDRLPETTKAKFLGCIEQTSRNTGLTMVIALSYSARWEITDAFRRVAIDAKSGTLNPDDITPSTVSSYLSTSAIPDPDLLIRTGGDFRISNFLLWQIAYTELFFTPVLWPDFRKKDLLEAITDFQHRQRRFGLTEQQVRDTAVDADTSFPTPV